MFHEPKTNYRGYLESVTRIKRQFHWPGIKKRIFARCLQIDKYDTNLANQKLMITPAPSKLLEIIHSYTFQAQGQKFLTIVDTFSKYAQAYPFSNLSGMECVKAFMIFMTHHAVPSLVIPIGQARN